MNALLGAAGTLWLFAAIAVVFAAACEAAKPRDNAPERGVLGVLAGVTALAAPFALLVHAFWAVAPHSAGETDGAPALVGVVGLIPRATLVAWAVTAGVLLLAPSLLGWALGRARGLARTLYRASPWLNAAALAFALLATYRSVAAVVDLALSGPG